jgi:phosphoglycerate dehydrogenase-like enzyme
MKPVATFILDENAFKLIYSAEHLKKIGKYVEINPTFVTENKISTYHESLKKVEIIFSGWGCPRIDEHCLHMMPELKIVFYGAGSVRGIVTDEFWKRGIRITSAWGANAVPVVEYTLASILFGLKGAFQQSQYYRRQKDGGRLPVRGAYHSTVGLVSLGMIAKQLIRKLKPFDLNIIAYDPFITKDEAKKMGIEIVSLEELFIQADVVSLHTPWLPETEGLITGELLRKLKPYSIFINTARGAIVREDEMISVLQERPDIFAILDVTHPEPPREDSLLFKLENVFLTPHIAGSLDNECFRMGQTMLEELRRYLRGEKLKFEILEEQARKLA